MKLKHPNFLQYLLFLILFPSVLLLSRPVALQPDTTYQTGVQTILSSNFTSTTNQVFAIPYVSVMTTASLNASLGIYGVKYYMINQAFGWRLFVSSLTSSDLIIQLAIFSAASPIYYLKVCYMISSNPNIDMSYVQYTFAATDAIADQSLYNAPTTGSCFIACRVYRTTQVYTSKPSATVRTFLSGFRVTSFGTFVTSTWDTFGIQLDPSSAGTSSYTMSVTVFGQANLAYVSFFYLSYDTTALNVLYSKTAMNGRSYLGCYYTQNTCNPVFPATVNPNSNTTFKTGSTSVLAYTSGMFYMGLDSMIVTYSGNTVNRGEFDISGLSQNTDTTVQVTFAFSGNVNNAFYVGYSYFTLQTFYCLPSGPDLYFVYGSNMCDSACNNTISQYMNASNNCAPCSTLCYKCVGSDTFCTACYNSQNRVLNGNACDCDVSAGYYDDLTSSVCPKCHYSCLTCNGGTSANCLTCGTTRYKNGNTCPCNIGFYDANASNCVACHYTCQTATCTGTTSTTCSSCNAAKYRANVTSNYTCLCMGGYFDNSTSSELCSPCRYSCLTCTTTNVYCTSCDGATSFRSLNTTGNTCNCMTGYYDNGVSVCPRCDSTCLTCSGGQTFNCLTCDGTLKRQLSVTTCVCANYFYQLNKLCTPCYYSCLTCANNTSTGCLTCDSTSRRTFKGTTNECPCNFGYVDMGVLACQLCSPSCLNCIYNTTSCSLCHNTTGRYLSGYSCLCDPGYVDLYTNGTCTPCHYSCVTCFDATSSGCNSCPSNRTLTINVCTCPTGFYDNGVSAVCQPCHVNCASCTNGVSSGCTACDALQYRTLNPSPTGTCICSIGYYQIGTIVCASCDPKCKSCNGLATNCTSCDLPTNRRSISSNFTCDCVAGFYETGATACVACVSICNTCSVISSNCTSCLSVRYLSNSTCYCNAGTFQNSSYLCQACSAACLTCVTTSTFCLSCPANANRYQFSNTCPCSTGFFDTGVTVCAACNYTCFNCSTLYTCDSCPTNSFRTYSPTNLCPCSAGYYDNGNPTCVKCSLYCLTCLTFSQCLSCNASDYRTISSFSCPCSSGYYQNGINSTCSACHYSCSICYGGASTNCYNCTSFRTFTMPYSCPCMTGYYESANVCAPCSISCRTCNILSTNCTSCPTTSYLSSFQCICNQGYFLNGLVCSQCDTRCQACITTSTFCTLCNPLHGTTINGSSCACTSNQYQNATSLVCINCSPYCLTCSANTNYSCLSCYSSMFRTYSGSQTCLCNSGYYDSGALICSLCASPCLTCNGGSVYNCTSCSVGYTLIGSVCMATVVCANYWWNGNCINTCPNTTFAGINACFPCINNCLTCTSSTYCTSCQINYFLSSNTCLDACPTGFYSNSTSRLCTSCPASCLTCVIRNTSVYCLSCNTNYTLLNSQCVNNCATGNFTYVIVSGMCKPCLYECTTCMNLTVNGCITCITNYNYYLGMCLSSCPQGYYADSQVCKVCITNCTSCTTKGCSTCITGYYLTAALLCVPTGYFMNENQVLTKCHPNCQTCSNSSFSSCILCSQYRGDASLKAVSGYCDCWKGSIDLGNGVCDIESYKPIEKANEALVSATTSLNYLSLLTGVVAVNYFSPVFLGSYQQLYSNFYYLNSSSVLQTDQVLNNYGNTCFNKRMEKQTNKNVKKQTNAFGRRLQTTTQSEESLFMRGYSWKYLIDWGLYTFICVALSWTVVAILIPIVAKLKKCVDKHSLIFKIVSGVLTIFRENIIIVIHILTINDVGFYGMASFKLLPSVTTKIDIAKMLFSVIMFAYYILYLLRLFVVGVRFVGSEEQEERFMVLFSCFYSHKKKEALCRIYLPMMLLRSLVISVCLVFLAFNPIGQIVSTLLVFVLFTIYSFFYCPYYFYLCVFIHIFQGLFILQLLMLTISVAQPDSSKIGPAFGLIVLNYLQLLNFLVLTIFIVINKIYDIRCWQLKEKRILPFKKQSENQEVHVPVYKQRNAVKVIEQSIQDVLASQPVDEKMDYEILKGLNRRKANRSQPKTQSGKKQSQFGQSAKDVGPPKRRRIEKETQDEHIDIFSLQDMDDSPAKNSKKNQHRDQKNN